MSPSVLRSICVFCGSSPGRGDAYLSAARALGGEIASRGLGLVYGGAHVGLMGAVADAALGAGGHVVGVIPEALRDKELAHDGLAELVVTGSMHERKAIMAERADAFVALPGGLGTLEELFEVWTWSQLGFHAKPCGLLNISGYYDRLIEFLECSVDEGFVRSQHRAMLSVASAAADLLDQLARFEPSDVPKWIDRDEI